jgi:hypothetical protein
MSRFAKLFAANAIAAAGLGVAAVALSPSAAADPVVPPAVPGVPALSMIQDFANPAGVGAVLQTAATALNGASAMVGAPAPNTLPVSPIVGAPAPSTLPVSPIVGAPAPSTLPVSPIVGAPATPPVPAAPTPATGVIGSTVVPLLTQIGVPAQLLNLAPQMPAVAAPIAAPAVTPVLPVAPAAQSSAAVNPLALLTALP